MFNKQIQNKNFLSPVGFNFTLSKSPKVSFFSRSCKVPEISLGTAIQPTYLKDIDVPGDKITYGDFYLNFFVDENMENYMVIHNWLTALGYPESPEQFKDFMTNEDNVFDNKIGFSDGSLRILNSNYRDVAIIKFLDLFPISLSPLEFEAGESDYGYFSAEVVFKYTIYEILGANGNPL